MKLEGKWALVTGGSRGIGRGICNSLAAEGCNVVVNYTRHPQAAEEVVAELTRGGVQAWSVKADVSNRVEVDAMVRSVTGRHQLDILVGNAGVVRFEPFLEITREGWDFQMNVNLVGSFNVGQEVARYFVARKIRGKIAFVTSFNQEVPNAGQGVYSISKSGIRMLARTMALELAEHGITVEYDRRRPGHHGHQQGAGGAVPRARGAAEQDPAPAPLGNPPRHRCGGGVPCLPRCGLHHRVHDLRGGRDHDQQRHDDQRRDGLGGPAMQYSVEIYRNGTTQAPGPEMFYLRDWDKLYTLCTYVFVVRSREHTMLVDTGCGDVSAINRMLAAEFGGKISFDLPEDETIGAILEKAKLRPSDVDHVFLTHLHHDHASNVSLFPNARVVVSRRGSSSSSRRTSRTTTTRRSFRPRRCSTSWACPAEKVVYVDDDADVLPGIRCFWVGGHTPCCMAVQVATSRGRVVITSDVAFFEENVTAEHPVGMFYSLWECKDAYRKIKAAADHVITSHDPGVLARFPGGKI